MKNKITAYEISMPISPAMPSYPGDPETKFEIAATIARDGYNVAKITLGTHCGTHIDAPRHFDDAGAPIDALPIERFITHCVVIEIRDEKAITVEELKENADKLKKGISVIFKTRNSERFDRMREFDPDYVYLTPEAAEYLGRKKVNLAGIDALSVERFEADGFPTHKALLKNNIVILEGLQLKTIEPGEYTLLCLPLNFVGLDASPVRAALIKGI